MKKCLFLDRDGVINIDKGYVHEPEQFELIRGIKKLLRAFKENGFLLIIVTNQSGIGRGFYSEENFLKFTSWMREQLEGLIDEVYFCPNHPTHGLGKYKKECSDRKPGAGMFIRAGKDFKIDFSKSVMIGDNFSDLDAANKVGINKLYLFNNTETKTRHYDYKRISSLDIITRDCIKKNI